MFDPNRVPTVTAIEAHRRLDEDPGPTGPLLVDVREPNEFADYRAEGAVLFPLSTFTLKYESLPRNRQLLMICQSGARSAQATAYLLANGWPDVANVEGGSLAWVRAGLPAKRGEPGPGEGELPA
jgi:rhodanese-related sulfurtransferase